MKRLQSALPFRAKRWFFLLLTANVLYMVLAAIYLHPLRSSDIVAFELAKETSVAEAMVQDWVAAGKYSLAIKSIYLDFIFIVLYTAGLAVACVYLSRLTAHEILMRTGYFCSYLLVAAGICDVIENVAMLQSLYGPITYWNVILAYDMAATKFSILILCLLFTAICAIFGLSRFFGSR